ncbi:glycosyltransferase [Siminovitchia sp. FSL H7-0308]|jgi:hypothetical protein|uniref:glycosyltransferase n=1 Tax=Siminovitchia sp. FSL H7-0308 TaxID=2921432 RepID=UPI0030EB59D4
MKETDVGSRLKVLQGTMEIANQLHTSSKGLEKNGATSKIINNYHSYLGYHSEYEIKDWKKVESSDKVNYIQNQLIPEFDLFHFHFSTSLLTDHSDLEQLRTAEKPIIMEHWGSEVRSLNKALQINRYAKVKMNNDDWISRKLEFLAENIPYCIAPDHEMHYYVKPYYQHVFFVPQMIDLSEYAPTILEKKARPLIVHAPTNPQIKGTVYILQAIEQLRTEFAFDFQLVQRMNHLEAKKIYEKADLIIDQLHLGSYGLFAIEAMALGKPVICYISDFMASYYPKTLPLISANPDTLVEKLRFLLNNQDSFPEIGRKGREYVEAHHDYLKNSAKLLKIYEAIIDSEKG